MDVTNTTGRDIFLGEKSRRGTSLDVGRQGIRFPAGGTVTVPDDLQRSERFGKHVDDGELVIVVYDSDPQSALVHGEEGVGALNRQIDLFTPTLGQTVFLLSETYAPGGFARFTVNGVDYSDFTIAGTTAIWTGPFSLDSGDDVTVEYEKT